jgi:DNA-binding GntR family transcriptional regulator
VSSTGTRAEEIYRAVRFDLLTAKYEPGEWVKVADLQRRFGVSLSVIREALNRLVAEGMLVAIALRGFRVVTLSLDDLRDLTDARVKIETLVLRDSLMQGDNAWEARLLAAHHMLEKTPSHAAGRGRSELNPEWIPAHSEFHQALLDGCPNARLLGVASALRDSAELYRMWSLPKVQMKRDLATEHRRLVKLALKRDVDECVDLLASHISLTLSELMDQAEK